jgi:glycosyltransferase involved in cell wall biosynthesis
MTVIDEFTYHITQVCLDYSPVSGGTTISIDNFRNVLRARVISFTSPKLYQCIRPDISSSDVTHLVTQDNMIGHKYSSLLESSAIHRCVLQITSSDLIICHMLFRYHVQWATTIALRAHIPYVILPHGSLDPYVFSYRTLRKRLWMVLVGRRILRNAGAIVFATHQERDKALPYIGNARSHIINWPIDFIDTGHRAHVRERIRAQHQIPQNDRILLFVGRLHPSKRALETIEAFERNKAQGLHLMMVGQDSDVLTQRECRHLCFSHGITNVHFIGPVYGAPKYDYYMAADAYISLSHKENFGYTVGEALACGLPVILSPGIALAHSLRSLKCGWILPTMGTYSEDCAFIEFKQTSRKLLEQMGQAGQCWVRNELSVQTFSRNIRELVKEIISQYKSLGSQC